MNEEIRIQIVDDSLLMRKKMVSVVEGLNYKVAGLASSGQQAIEAYEELQPDIVLMDVAMPELSGIETVKLMVSQFPQARIIMVSSLNQKAMVVEALASGAKNFIIKPFKADTLKEAIIHVIQAVEEEL